MLMNEKNQNSPDRKKMKKFYYFLKLYLYLYIKLIKYE